MTELERFSGFVAIDDGCWEWQGALLKGYGRFRLTGRSGRAVLAHRYLYEQFRGPIPAGLHACHSCDNPKCVRPSHIFPGTAQENADDAIRKGRRRVAQILAQTSMGGER